LARLNPNDLEGDYDFQLDLCGNFATPCDPDSVLCQEALGGNNYNLGLRGTYNILHSQSNDTHLVVRYGLGDSIFCDSGASRLVTLHFYCTDQPRSSFKVTEVSQCTYRGDVYVAASLCSTVLEPTPPLPDFCYPAGYLDSTTGLYWTLQKFLEVDFQGQYAFQVNLCGNSPTECATNTAVCQQSTQPYVYSLGSRYNFTILPDYNGMLSVLYQGGDYCDVVNNTRQTYVFLNCTDTNLESSIEAETGTCNYTVTVQVPSKYCSTVKPIVPTLPPIVEHDFCTESGYSTSTGRAWSLSNFVPDYDTQSNYNYVLNLCGTTPNNCPGTAAICQEAGETLGWSLGAYNNYTIDDSQDGVLTIHYFGGDYCNAGNYSGDRESTVILTCNDSNFTSFVVNETTTCHYTITASVPTANCGNFVSRDQGSKHLASGAVAGITVGVVGAAVAGGVFGSVRLYKMKNARRFTTQSNME
jgi:hypothetical protein